MRQIFSGIGAQLSKLSVTQRLLIASLCVVLVMTLFLVSQYAGSPKTVDLLPSGTGEDQQKAAAFLDQRGITYIVKADGKVAVSPEARYTALAAMAKDQQLPGDKRLLFTNLAGGGGANWMEPLADKQQKANIALQNELAMVIANFPGVEKASVFISAPEARGLGAAARRPVAQVAVFPVRGQPLDQGTVNALADLVAGSVAGLDSKDVAIIDGTNRRSHRAVSAEDLAAGGAGGGSYVEQVARVEQRVQQKLEEHLRFIPDVIVSVNAMVDAARRESVTTRVLNKGEGTVSLPSEETSSTQTSQSASKGPGEPGAGANIQMDVNRAGAGGGGGGTSTNDEQSTIKNSVRFGESTTKQRDAAGRPTKINVTVGVPREYVAEVVKLKKGAAGGAGAGGAAGPGGAAGAGGAAEPSEAEIAAEFENAVKATIEMTLAPLIETDSGMLAAASGAGAAGGVGQITSGTVKAFLIPVAMSAMSGGGVGGGGGGAGRAGLGGGGTGGGGMLGSLSSAMENSLIKTGALGLLALVAIGLMFTMVRKAGKAAPLPTAEELVGIPPALEPGSDVVGEADEGATPMQGIEIDDEQLKTAKMLEEIGTLVKSNPQNAAGVLNRWLTPEE
ncbi:MAG: hypothetical protein K2W85_00135 [Phycisphaerales bacterium]|nr:hypothetical protein [Phycisphaerales bacterium]